MNRAEILKLEKVTKSFAYVKVLKDVSLSVKSNSILGLVGENGAGKSTLMNILGGIHNRDSGRILLHGEAYAPKDPLHAQKHGIAFIQQELNLFTNLTVMENLYINAFPKKGLSIDYSLMKSQTLNALSSVNAKFKPDTLIGELRMGERQLVEICKALLHDAEIIIFDEPTTSLTTTEKESLFRVIENLRAKGKAVIYISHILEDVFRLCKDDEIAVLRDGIIIGQEHTKKLSLTKVIKMMVGRELNKIYPTVQKKVGKVVFEALNINNPPRVKDVSLTLREGEIVGMFGIMGAGRSEFARAVFGVDKMVSGEVKYNGEQIHPVTPKNCIEHGIAFITENRREEGLLLSKSVLDNTILASIPDTTKKMMGFIDREKEQSFTKKMVNDLNIKTYDSNEQTVVTLSGGNQQKVVFGKWVLREPKVFILDEPTRGVDVGAKYEIYTIINKLAANKSTILVISSEMEELMGICDRIMVMAGGALIAEIEKSDFCVERIMEAAVGGIKK